MEIDKADKDKINSIIKEYQNSEKKFKVLIDKFISIGKEIDLYEEKMKILRENEKKYVDFLLEKYNITERELIYTINTNTKS